MNPAEFRDALNGHAQASADLAVRMLLMAEAIRTGDGWKHPHLTAAEDAPGGPGLLALLRRCQRADELLAGAVGDLRAVIMQQAANTR